MELSSKPPVLQYGKGSFIHILIYWATRNCTYGLCTLDKNFEITFSFPQPPTHTRTHVCTACSLLNFILRVSHLISQAGPEHVIFLSQPSNQMVFQLCLTLSGCGLLCGRDGISCLVVKKCSRKQKQMLMIKSNFLHSFRNVCCTLTMSRYHSRCWR